MKLLNVEVHNILKVTDAELDVSGHHLFLVGGKNGHGKSSVLKAIACALCGKRDMGDEWPDVLLQEGKDRGWVKLQLSGDEEMHQPDGITVELLLRRKRGGVVAEEFRVMDVDGDEAAEPRHLLKQLYSFRAFDPLDFERAKPKDRAELLRKLVGLDFSELDEERAEKYKERTKVNSEGKSKKAQLDAIEVPEDTPDEPVLARDLFAKLQDAQANNDAYAKENAKSERLAAKEQKLIEEERKLKERLEEIDKERREMDFEISAQEKIVASLELIDLEPIKEQIESADKINRAVELKQKKAELKKETDDLRKQSTALTNRLKAIDEEKQERLENAEWPLKSMSLDEGGVLLDGLPFEQASKAQRVLASVRVGMALNPRLRLLVCQDGNDLDNETMAALDEVLEKEDFQLLLEYVTRDSDDEGRCAVVMRDGTPVEVEA